MKRIICLLMILLLVGCGSNASVNTESDTGPVVAAEVTQTENNDFETESLNTEFAGWPEEMPPSIPILVGDLVYLSQKTDIVAGFEIEEETAFQDCLDQYQIQGWEVIMGSFESKKGTFIFRKGQYAVIINAAPKDLAVNLVVGEVANPDSSVYTYFEETASSQTSDYIKADEEIKDWPDEIDYEIPKLWSGARLKDMDYGLKVIINDINQDIFNGFREKFADKGWNEEYINDQLSYFTLSGYNYFIGLPMIENYTTLLIGYDYSEDQIRAICESDGQTTSSGPVASNVFPDNAPEEVVKPTYEEWELTSVMVTYGTVVHYINTPRDQVVEYIDLYAKDDSWHVFTQSVDDTWISYSAQKNNVILTLEYDMGTFEIIWELTN